MRTPDLYSADQLTKWDVAAKLPDGRYVPARPMSNDMRSPLWRFMLAWLVFTGKCDALGWNDQKTAVGTDGWISIKERLPRHGDGIRGKSDGGEWDEVWDRDEPIGRMTHWKRQTITREMEDGFFGKRADRQSDKSGISSNSPQAT